jgi:hypothetical protein
METGIKMERSGLFFTGIYDSTKTAQMVKQLKEIKAAGYKAKIVYEKPSKLSRNSCGGYSVYADAAYHLDKDIKKCEAYVMTHSSQMEALKKKFETEMEAMVQRHKIDLEYVEQLKAKRAAIAS